jgi:hypothetical protein
MDNDDAKGYIEDARAILAQVLDDTLDIEDLKPGALAKMGRALKAAGEYLEAASATEIESGKWTDAIEIQTLKVQELYAANLSASVTTAEGKAASRSFRQAVEDLKALDPACAGLSAFEIVRKQS